MKATTLIAAAGLLAALASAPGLAQQKAREDVRAEAASAAKAGLVEHGETAQVPAARSSKSRAEVKSDTRAAVKAGAIDGGEVTSVAPSKPSTKTRAEVKAEAASAIHPKPAPKAARKAEETAAKKE